MWPLRDPTDPHEWLRRARSNLARAKADRGLPEILYEDLCFDAQQAAEKAIKAILVQRQIPFPKTHRITELLRLAESTGVTVPQPVKDAGSLSQYASETRYPGASERVSGDEYAQAVVVAERAVRWAEEVVGGAQRSASDEKM